MAGIGGVEEIRNAHEILVGKSEEKRIIRWLN